MNMPPPDDATVLFALGVKALDGARKTDDGAALDQAVELLQRALHAVPANHADRADRVAVLGFAFLTRFERTGSPADLDRSIELHDQLVSATPPGHPELMWHLSNLGTALWNRSRLAGNIFDLDRAVSAHEAAVIVTPEGHPGRAGILSSLAAALWSRHERTGSADDLDRDIEVRKDAIAATSPDQVDPDDILLLGRAFHRRFNLVDNVADLDGAIAAAEAALTVTSRDHPGLPMQMYTLGSALSTRFERTGIEADLERAVELEEAAVSTFRPGDPNWALSVSSLGLSLHKRFEQTGSAEDLDRAIELLGHAVIATPPGDPNRGGTRLGLGLALRTRFEHTGSVEDLDRAIELLGEAVAATPPSHRGPHPVFNLRAHTLFNLGAALARRFERTGSKIDLDRAIEVLEEGETTAPPGHPGRVSSLSTLGVALTQRFERIGDVVDLGRAIVLLEQAVAAAPRGNTARVSSLSMLGAALATRFEHSGNSTDMDRAIEVLEQALTDSPAVHTNRIDSLTNLGNALERRFERTGNAGDLDRSIELLVEAVTNTPPSHALGASSLTSLAGALTTRFEQAGNTADLDRAIDLHEQALTATPREHTRLSARLTNLGAALHRRFGSTGNTADLDHAIELHEMAMAASPPDHPFLAGVMTNLGSAIEARFKHSGSALDLRRALGIYRQAADMVTAPVVDRARIARQWGRLAARSLDWNEAAEGFTVAVNLAGLAVPWELERSDQEFRLGEVAGLGAEAAAACIHAGHPDRAVELFEQGRAILFSQILDARSDLTDLREAHPELAEHFVRCREVLGRPEIAVKPSSSEMDPATAARLHSDARRAAAAEFEHALSTIRTLPGFQRFLAPRSLTELLPAAANGPVALLNIASTRSDALILTQDGVETIPLPEVDPETVIRQVNIFLAALGKIHTRAARQAIAAANQDLAGVLTWLGDHIAGPVLDQLGYTGTPLADTEWPRVWWCPGGPLSFLPIHAAGHHLLADIPNGAAVIDRVISSTIPTLRALTQARAKPNTDTELRVLVVAMPATAGHSDLPGAAKEAATLQNLYTGRTHVLGLPDTDAATHDAVIAALPAYPCVHFACHGSSDLNNPSASHLLLPDRPLSVSDLIHTRLENAELAFLSACTTARSGGRLFDEPIHLAAACQLAGYRHVVASLWPISDADTAWLTNRFYRNLHTASKAADAAGTALHHGTRDLRATNRASPHIWAPYVHTGP